MRRRWNDTILIGVALVATTAASPVWAQGDTTKYVPEAEIKQAKDDNDGLDGLLGVAANLALSQNDSVAGQADGVSLLLGLSLVGGLDYIDGAHELRNTLQLIGAWAKTPAVEEFLKTNDLLGFESLYSYFITEWFGAFGRLAFASTMLPTEDVRSDAKVYSIKRQGQATPELTRMQKRLTLSDPFQPASLMESAGLFVEPYRSQEISVSLRAGIGGRETFADGVLVLKDDDSTADIIEVVELTNVYQGGVEAFLGIKGKLFDKRMTYAAGGNVLFPLLNNDETDRSILDLTYLGASVDVAFSVVEWMSINYQFRALYDPQLIEDVQIQNNVLLALKYDFIERNTPPPPPPPVDAEKEALKKQLDEALKASEAAKARADELEKKLAPPPAEAPAPAEPAPEASPE